MLPRFSAILTGLQSTFQTSIASNDNSLYALHHLAPDPTHKCLPLLQTTPPTNHQKKVPSTCHLALPQHQCPLLSRLALSRPPCRPSLTSTPHSSNQSQMGSSKPLQIVRLTQLLPRRAMRIASTIWSSASSITRKPSTMLPMVSSSIMDKSPISTSWWVMGYTRRQSGSNSMMMEWSWDTLQNKVQISSPISLICTPPPTTASTHPSSPYLHGSNICSQVLAATSTFSKLPWPTPTTGAWRKRSHITGKSMTMSPISQSKSRSTSGTLRQHGPILHHMSPALCSLKPQSMSSRSITC
jgi:hypothetical protein